MLTSFRTHFAGLIVIDDDVVLHPLSSSLIWLDFIKHGWSKDSGCNKY
jgi:hypothetical protein